MAAYYVGGGRDNHIYALEAKSGCIVWKYKTRSEVRSAIVLSPPDPDGLVKALFGDTRGTIYAIDASSGKHLWRTRIEEHPATTITGSPVYYKGRLFVGVSSGEEFTGAAPDYQCCTFRGSLVALDADNGERLWKTYTIPQQPLPGRRNNHGVIQHGPSGAGIWSAPTIDTCLGRIYITTGDDYSDPATTDSDAIIAFDMDSGKRLWSRQFTPDDAYNMACNPRVDQANCPQARGPDYDFGSSAILVENRDGQRLLVAGQKSGFVHAVDPDQDGVIVWRQRAGAGGTLGGVQYGPAVDSNNIYVAISDISFGRIRDQEGKMRGGAIPDVGGGITAYRLKDGKQIWHTPGYAMSCWAMGLLTSTVSSSNSDSWRCVLRCTRRSYPGLLNREWPVAVEL